MIVQFVYIRFERFAQCDQTEPVKRPEYLCATITEELRRTLVDVEEASELQVVLHWIRVRDRTCLSN